MNQTNIDTECKVFDQGHIFHLDMTDTSPSKTVYVCICGAVQEVYEDCGTGA